MQKVSGTQFANNAIWKFLELIVRKLIGLVISTILARILLPEAYGIVALTTVFITFSDIFILNGFNVALIRKDRVSEEDYSTVMILSLVFTTVLYCLFFFSAPAVASFYKTPELKGVLRTITILLFFQSVATVIRAKGTRELRFREMSIVTVIENVTAGFIGLYMAYKGFGVWALVFQQVSAAFLDMVLLSIVFRWKYRFAFRVGIVRDMLSFTAGVLGSSFMDFLGNNANSLVVGRTYSSTELGYMNRGNMYPEVIGLNTYNAINSVLLPALASRQNDRKAMHDVVRKVVSVTEYIILPLMIGLAGVSRNFIIVFLTKKWLPCLIILNCACINYMIQPIRSIGSNVFYALGESKTIMRVEGFRVLAMLANLITVIVLLRKSIYVLVFGNLVIAFCVLLIMQKFVSRAIGYTYKELFMDVLPTVLLSVPMLAVALMIDRVLPHNVLSLTLQILAGAAVYLIGSWITKNKNFLVIKNTAYERIKKK